MINIKSKNGITIISLIITIIILLILTSIVIINIDSSQNINKLNNMYADLKLLEEKTLVYYNKYGDIPKKDTDLREENIINILGEENIINILGEERNQNDSSTYYEIDASKLENVTLNYGEGTGKNIYIINDRTLTIYYLKGIKYDGQEHHSYPYEYSRLNALMIDVKYHLNYFDENDEAIIQTIEYTRGVAVNNLYQPTRVGYRFDGWYRNTLLEGETVIALRADETNDEEDIDLFAKWTRQKYTISFNSNGGSNVDSITDFYGQTVTSPVNPTKADNIFEGWYTDSNFTGNAYVFSTMPGQDITLYAKWKVAEASIGTTPYEFIEDAILVANTGDTIRVVKNLNKSSAITISSEKNIIINLNGNNISSNNEYTIINNGTLIVQNTNTTESRILNTENSAINNLGELTITVDTNDLTNSRRIKEKLQIEGKNVGINNQGTVILNNGIIYGETDTISGNDYTIPDDYYKFPATEGNKKKLYVGKVSGSEAVIEEREQIYVRIEQAIEDCRPGETIKIINAVSRDSININAEKDVIIDLNSTEIVAKVINNGTLTITDNSENKTGTITNIQNTITNNGTMTLLNGTILGTQQQTIYNNGTFTMNGGEIIIETNSSGNSVYCIYNQIDKNVTVNGGRFKGISKTGGEYITLIFNYLGTIYLNNAELIGTVETQSNFTTAFVGITNYGSLTIDNSLINFPLTRVDSTAIYNNKETIYSFNGVYHSIIPTVQINSIREITSKIGIENNGILNFGNNNGIYLLTPEIQGAVTGIINYETMNFYDGKIIGPMALTGMITSLPEEYEVKETEVDGIKTIELIEKTESVAIIRRTDENENIINNEYNTIADAISDCQEGETITINKSLTMQTIIIPSNKNVIIDLNSKTIEGRVINEGTLKIKDSGNGVGKILYSYSISNNGDNNRAIYTTGTLIVESGTIEAIPTNNLVYGIYSLGNTTITGGTINVRGNATNYGIKNLENATLNITGGTINVLGFSSSSGIWNENGILLIEGGVINNTSSNLNTYGINNGKSGTVTVKNIGENDIIAKTAINNSGILTIGEFNVIPSVPPIIKGITVGIQNNSGATINFYGGKIKGPTAFRGNISNIPEDYETLETELEGIKTIELIHITEPAAIIIRDENNINYNTVAKAIQASETGETIIVNKNLENQSITIPLEKNVIIDLNSKVISGQVINNGILKITDQSQEKIGAIQSSLNPIQNTGTLTLEEGTIRVQDVTTAITTYVIYNTGGTLNVNGGIIKSDLIVNTTGGTVNNYGIYSDGGAVEISDGLIDITCSGTASWQYSYGIYSLNNCQIHITNGEIKVASTGGSWPRSYGIYNNTGTNNNTLTIENGKITVTSSYYAYGVQGGNTILIGGKVTVTANNESYGVYYGKLTMSGGEIKVRGGSSAYGMEYSQNSIITGGTIESNKIGIYQTSITIGSKDANVSTETPQIIGTNKAISSAGAGYWIKYYDGKIISNNTLIEGDFVDIPEMYVINTETVIENEETKHIMTLAQTTEPVVKIGNTGYNTIQEAIASENCPENALTPTTIVVNRDVYTTNAIEITNGRNVIIDLNGLNIFRGINNYATLEIKDSIGTGMLNIANGTGLYNATAQSKLFLTSGTIRTKFGSGISNYGILEMYGGKINALSDGIYNSKTGKVIIDIQTTDNENYDIYASGNGGGSYGIKNHGTVTVKKGVIYGGNSGIQNLAIYDNSTPDIKKVEILGGKVTSNDSWGAIWNYSSNSLLIVGDITKYMDTENPQIAGTYLGLRNSGTINFYGGVISGTEAVQNNAGSIFNKRTGYIENITTINNKKYLTLQEAGTELTVATIGVNYAYNKLQLAIDSEFSNNNVIKLTGDVINELNITIPTNKQTTIDLNGHTIQNGIINNGTLIIIDTSEEQSGKVNNSSGVGITNSGTLTLGNNEGTVAIIPTIQGSTYGVQNSGTMYFYDGKLMGQQNGIDGTTPIIPEGYTMTGTTTITLTQ